MPVRKPTHARPKVAVDTVLFSLIDGRLKSYLVQVRGGEHQERWAFPGGLVREGEMLDDAAHRELHEFTGLADAYLEQLFTFGDPSRDPRSHVVSVAYMALIPDWSAVTGPDGNRNPGRWFDATELPPLAYDHSVMAQYALRRLRGKFEYTNIAYTLLPREFTFAQLEDLYSLILDRPIDRRNFRRRIMGMGLLKKSPTTRRGPHRPAALYSFSQQTLQTIEMI